MEKGYKLIDDIGEANAFAALVNSRMSYANSNPKGRYTEVEKHLTEDKWMVLVCQKCHPNLSQEEIDSLKTHKEVVALGYLPVIEIFGS